ncbi:MAG: hypothetical protein ACMUHX_11320 [bacterium]
MKRAILDRPLNISKENKILVKLFEENLRKKLDEIFKKEPPNLYNNMSKGLKKAIAQLSPEDHPPSDAKSNL